MELSDSDLIVSTNEQLRSLVDRAGKARVVALDTEFVWTQTYSPRLGLIQLGWSNEDCYLIDVLSITDLEPLATLLRNPSICKVLHDAQQDLTILREATGAYPVTIFDTRLAAGFIAHSSVLSLAALLKVLLQVDLEKTETRTDWLKRPLTEKQRQYALDDVRYLPDLRTLMLEKAESAGTLPWLSQELQQLDSPQLYEVRDSSLHYLKFKGIARLNRGQLARLQALTSWREEEARVRNLPRGHVMEDAIIQKIASFGSPVSEELLQEKFLPKPKYRRYGATICALLAAVNDLPEDQRPPVVVLPSLSPEKTVLLADVTQKINDTSATIGIDPALVCTRKEITACLAGDDIHLSGRLKHGWRREFISKIFQASHIAFSAS